MKRLIVLTILITFFLLINNAYAPEPLNFKVHVSVSCQDETTKNLLLSSINRELRNLGDVALVDMDDTV